MFPLVKVTSPFQVSQYGATGDWEPIPINVAFARTDPPGTNEERLNQVLDRWPEDPQAAAPPLGGISFRPYQRRAVSFMRTALQTYGLARQGFRGNGCLYVAAPGLGKTPTSLEVCHLEQRLQRPGLVIAPLQARRTWCGTSSDPIRFFNLPIRPLDAEDLRGKLPPPATWYFLHYEILDDAYTDIIRASSWLSPETIIFDECHYASNSGAKRTEACRALTRKGSVSARILLTATPIRSSRMNLWAQLDIMQPGQWGKWEGEFGERYCGMTQQQTQGHQVYWVMGPPTRTEELRSRMANFVLKISRGTAAAYGGTRISRTPLWQKLTGDDRAELQEAILASGRKAAAAKEGAKPKAVPLSFGNVRLKIKSRPKEGYRRYPKELVALTHAISAMAEVKVRHAARIAFEAAERHPRFVVFTERRRNAQRIVKELKTITDIPIFGPIDGNMRVDKRWDACENLGRCERGILVATASSIGVSNHSLQCATGCLIVTPAWNPDANLQLEGRLLSEGDEPGRVKESLYLFLDGNIVDQRILEKIGQKEQETEDILGLGPHEAVAGDLTASDKEEMDMASLWHQITQDIQGLSR